MENKLDILTQKLYTEGVDKARAEAGEILAQARKEAESMLAEAENKAKEIEEKARAEAENLKKKAESEMSLSARQALTALKQDIIGLISGEVAGKMAAMAFEDKKFVQELLLSIIKKWDVTAGSLNLEVLLSEEEKKRISNFYRNPIQGVDRQRLGNKSRGAERGFRYSAERRRLSDCFFRSIV